MGGMANTAVAATREGEEERILIQGDEYPLTITDYLNNTIVLENTPKRIAVSSGTFLNMWYALGGSSICTSELNTAYLDPDYAQKMLSLPSIGQVYNPNLEALIELQPDFVIGQVGTQSSMVSRLKEMGIPALALHMRSYEDVLIHLRAFGTLLGTNNRADMLIRKMEEEKALIEANIPDDKLSVVILYVTSRSLAVKLDNSIAGDVASILKLDNIASDLPPDTLGSETAPLDIEYIVEKAPDFVLVTSMISSNEEAQRMIAEEFERNSAWQTVEAVREKRIIFLPQKYFLYNAGHRYVDAIRFMAQAVYPEISFDVKE